MLLVRTSSCRPGSRVLSFWMHDFRCFPTCAFHFMSCAHFHLLFIPAQTTDSNTAGTILLTRSLLFLVILSSSFSSSSPHVSKRLYFKKDNTCPHPIIVRCLMNTCFEITSNWLFVRFTCSIYFVRRSLKIKKKLCLQRELSSLLLFN